MSYTNGIGNTSQTAATAFPAEKLVIQKEASNDVDSLPIPSMRAIQTDQTNISTSADLVIKALSGPDAQSARIESLRQSIASGTYTVPLADVADKLIQSLVS